jgi:hypothetical protein
MIKNLDHVHEHSSSTSAYAFRGKPWNSKPGYSKYPFRPNNNNRSYQDTKFRKIDLLILNKAIHSSLFIITIIKSFLAESH